MKLVGKQLVVEESDVQPIKDGVVQHQFLTLAQKYALHRCDVPDCLACEAIGTIINNQNDLDHAEFQKGLDNADLDAEGIPF